MELTKEDVYDIALLARIGVTDNEVERYQKDLSSVLGYFEKLQEVDTVDVEEIGHITGVTDVYRRDDVIEMSEEGKEMMMNSVPNEDDGYIKVKSVL
ncbi:MAG TPA: Asp-tRNA(Asn)/Glu-tRNA(Gln) amidotransferase subunit GatC [Candidatus Pacebacteria bacterium]|nr:Asp-tRNA(Asn)/Glu-tRNA(Gln) amidotransferase subunit GatC [Candidatus Paceibacterota bacterium]